MHTFSSIHFYSTFSFPTPQTQQQHYTAWKVGKSGIKKKVYSNENFANMLEESYNEEQTKLQQEQNEQDEIQLSIKERSNRISQLLFVYARDHSEIGYRQGMHEVLSYILLAIEMDLLNLARSVHRKQMRKSQTSFGFTNNTTNKNEREGSMAGVDDKGNMVVVKLLDPEYILHDAYNLFECIMTALAPAYDVIPVGDEEAAAAMMDNNEVTTTSGGEEKESPMEIMTGKSALVSLYLMISCVRYEDLAIWILHLTFYCLYLVVFASCMH